MPTLLPDPELGERHAECLSCAYALEGISDAGLCPECGTPFFEPEDTLVLHGVARQEETVTWRKWAWGALIVLGVLYFQVAFLFIVISPIAGVLIFVTLLAGVVGMVVSGTSARQGAERFIFTPAGFSRSPAGSEGKPTFQHWGDNTHADLKRVGAVWYRLRLADRSEGKATHLLDAGVRCPDDHAPWVREILERFVRRQPNPRREPTNHDQLHA